MSTRSLNKLPAKFVSSHRKPGAYEDGGGLRLVVDPSGKKRWVLRLSLGGRRTSRGLGAFPEVTLEQAREKASPLRKAARAGRDLAGENKFARLVDANRVTFRQAFDLVFEVREKQLSNLKHRNQWRTTMETYAYPKIGDKAVAYVTADDVIGVLLPIWFDKQETARRVLQRMNVVFDGAILRGFREKANPCIGVSDHIGTGHREVVHYRSLPYSEVPAFLTVLREKQSISRLCLLWVILTACRSGEARGARWSEIDQDRQLWMIPKQRMKGRKEHIVPLSQECMAFLTTLRAFDLDDDLMFPGPYSGRPLSDMALTKLIRDLKFADRATAHGFRSSFKDWCAEAGVPDDVSEAALAHVEPNKVKKAYQRTDFLDMRRKLMSDWGTFCIPVHRLDEKKIEMDKRLLTL